MSSLSTPRILSVEDDPDTRFLLRHMLAEGYKVAFAADAEEALRLLEEGPFVEGSFEEAPSDDGPSEGGSPGGVDLFLLDIHLGEGKNGTELLQQLREREGAAKVPAIAVTAYAMPGDREKYLEKGFDAYVSKPFSAAELTSAIEKALPSR